MCWTAGEACPVSTVKVVNCKNLCFSCLELGSAYAIWVRRERVVILQETHGNCNVIKKQNDSARIRNKIRAGFKMKCFLTLSYWEIQIKYRCLTLRIGHDKWNKETRSLPKEFGTHTWHTHMYRQTPTVTCRAMLLLWEFHPWQGPWDWQPASAAVCSPDFALICPPVGTMYCCTSVLRVSFFLFFFFFFLAPGSGCLPYAPRNLTNIGPIP